MENQPADNAMQTELRAARVRMLMSFAAATLFRFVIPGLLILFLWFRFPGDRIAFTLIGVAFLFEQLIDDPLLRLLPWSILGSTAAWYSMQLAFHLDQVVNSYSAAADTSVTSVGVGFVVVRSIANLGSLMFLVGRLPIGSRAFAFVTFISIGFGSLAYYGRTHSTDLRQELYYEYSFPSVGCSIGTILGIVLLIFYATFREAFLQYSKGSEPADTPERR